MKSGYWPAVWLLPAVLAAACSGSVRPPSTTRTTSRATAALASGDFGTLKGVCGPGTGRSNGKSSGPAVQGVSATTIDVGTMADPGAVAAPGLDQALFDAATAFAKWCNAAGGVNGRELRVHLRDAKLFEVPQRTIEACAADFAEVGGGTAFDDAGVAQRVKCGLPEIAAFDNSPAAAEASLQVQGDPSPVEEAPAALFVGAKRAFPSDTNVGFLSVELAGVLSTRDRFQEAAQTTGFTTVYRETYPVNGPDSWAALVAKMKASGVQVLSAQADEQQLTAMLRAMHDAGWYPDAIVETADAYDNRIWQQAGPATAHLWTVGSYYPLEEGQNNPATAQFLSLMTNEDPSAMVTGLSLNAWGAWLLFATAAGECGADLTRECLLQRAGAHTDWTAGGLRASANTDPLNRHESPCFVAMKATPAGWQHDPGFLPPTDGIYNCDPANVVVLHGDYRPQSTTP